MYLEMYISCYKVRNSPNLQINCEAPSLTAETDSSEGHEICHHMIMCVQMFKKKKNSADI